jgi:2-polyprenyl-6-methoxyphenol hydroxylase-like FAD-dependent oxidoreductase
MGGRALARLQFRGVHSRFPSVLSLPQAETERILIDAAAAPARGVRFVDHEARGDEIVARLLHADGREEEALCDWLIGCDGAHSSVRHALRAGFSGMRYAETFLLADCRIDGLDSDSIHAFLDRAATLAFFPLPGGAWRAIRVLERDEQPPELRSLAMFEQPHLNLADLMWWSSFQVSRWIVERYDFGHVLLAGDAAHIHSPVGGQGMNLGIQDAYALACALRDGTVAEWAKQRRAVARRVLSATDLATRLLSLRGSIACSVRMSVLRWVASRPSLAGRLEHGLAGMGYPSIPN